MIFWKFRFEELKKFIDKYKIRPTPKNNKELYSWTQHQINIFKKQGKIMINNNKELYHLWYNFVNNEKYKKYFLNYEQNWKINLKELKNFIDTKNARPTPITNSTLCSWMQSQIKNSKERKYIMKNNEIYKLWTDFINNDKYKKYFE
jgi:hypothetical protein